jgi:hypothetical protein
MSLGGSRRQNDVQIDVVLGMDRPDIALVDELAHLQLWARRNGWTIEIRSDSSELVELVELAGLSDVISVEVRR